MPEPSAPRPQLVALTEATFARRVLAAPGPVVVRFGTPRCAACRVMAPLLDRLASSYAGRLLVGTINVDTAALLIEQYAIQATPTLMLFTYGDVITRAIGFAPEGLLRLLFEQVARGELPPDPIWSPTEAAFEDTVLIPLLQRWGLPYARQVPCALGANSITGHGRIDVLVYHSSMSQPLTLFENKRHIRSARELQQAVTQAHAYARALGLASFVVAAPSGMWIYAQAGTRAVCVKTLTSLEIERDPNSIPRLLIQFHTRPAHPSAPARPRGRER
jgi:thioredoxin